MSSMTPATDQHRPPQAKPAAGSSGGRRPLLDLFPPRASGTSSARSAEQQPAAEPAAAQSTVIGDGLTYEPFYGLAEKAFSLAPDPKFLYYSASHGHAAQEILSAIRRREGIAVLTGESGSGKTTLCHALIDQLDRRTLTAMVSDPFVGIEALLKTLLIQFGVASWDEFARGRLAQATRNDLATALREFLKSLAALQAVALVVIDEAQEMSVEMFDHLRIISADPESSDRLQLLLVGQPELRDLIARRELRDLAQRVVVRCELEPLADDEIAGYVQRRLSVAASAKPNLAVKSSPTPMNVNSRIGTSSRRPKSISLPSSPQRAARHLFSSIKRR